MLVFQDADQQRFVAHTYVGIVIQMREAAWKAPGKLDYMLEVAARIKTLDCGVSQIRTSSPEDFVRSLEQYGWLHRLS